MSGPITAGYFLVSGTLALASRVLAEARAMKGEYHDVLARVRAREGDIARQREQRQAARLERMAAMHRRAGIAAARVARLRALAGDTRETVVLPAAHAGDAEMSAAVDALDAEARTLEATLDARAPAGDASARLAHGHAVPTIDDVLSAYAHQRARTAGLGADDAARFKDTAARVLARLALPEGEPLPASLAALARAVVMAPGVDRAEALALELRHAVQRAGEARAARARDAETASALLAQLGAASPVDLVEALERVAAGLAPMDEALRDDAQALLEGEAADQERADQEAAAFVLQQSLRDLGYAVEDIDATLFVDGGTVNFRRAGWDRYFVRLRVAPRERTVNFNVVRARGDEETDERRRLDALAEDRWCAEFPALLRTLEARGLALAVTRRLEAGEVPVQVVDPGTVPAVPADDARNAAPPAQRHRPA